jgi:hypothetical protein
MYVRQGTKVRLITKEAPNFGEFHQRVEKVDIGAVDSPKPHLNT